MAANTPTPAPTPTPEAPPEPRGVAAVWAFPAVVALWTWVVGWLPHMVTMLAARNDWDGWGMPPADVLAAHADDLPRWTMAGGGLLLAGVGWVLAEQWDRYGLAGWFRVLSAVTGLGVGAWLVAAAYSSPFVLAPHLAGLALLLGAGWWAIDYTHDRRAAAARPGPAAVMAAETEGEEQRAMREALTRSHNADVIIVNYQQTKAGQTWELGPRTHDPDTGDELDALPDYGDFVSRLPQLRARIQARWRRKGVEFDENDIRTEASKVDRWFLHINLLHPEKEEIPAAAKPAGRRSWNDPAWLGRYMMDGADMALRMHGVSMKILGKSEGGKSTIANNVVRNAITTTDALTGRRDCVVFVAATDKLAPFVYPYLRPFLDGSMGFPVLDWCAGNDPYEVLRLFRAVYHLARSRNDELAEEDKILAASSKPGVVVIWEEARHGGDRPETIEVDREEWSISRLCMETMGMCRSAGIGIVPLTQDGVMEGIGPYGSQCQRNFSAFACTRTTSHADTILNLTALKGQQVDTTALTDNTIYLQPNIGDTARALPGKCANVRTAAIITPLVMAESAPLGPAVFPAEDVAAMGEDYTGRWQRARNATLTKITDRHGWEWREYGAPQGAPAPSTPSTPAAPARPAATGASTTRPPVDDPVETALHMLAVNAGEDPAGIIAQYRAGTLDAGLVGLAQALLGGPGTPVDGLPTGWTPGAGTQPTEPAEPVKPTGWTAADDEAVAALLGSPVSPVQFTPPTRPEPTRPAEDPDDRPQICGLPSKNQLADLERLAQQMATEADAMAGAGQASTTVDDAPTTVDDGLPQVLRDVAAAVASIRADRPDVRWVATAELAQRLYPCQGEKAVEEATAKLGKALSLQLPNLTRRTDFYGPGRTKRGRGYDVAPLLTAIAGYRGR